MTKNVFFILLIILSCSSCHRVKKQNTEKTEGKKIYLKEQNLQKEWNYSQLFDGVEVIPLETNDQSLIGELTRIEFVNHVFYILDRRTQSLMAFSQQGKFLWKINTPGRGPEEYNRVIDMDIDSENQIINLYANYPQKLMQYDLKGKFIKEYTIHLNANSIALQKNWLLLNAANQANMIHKKLIDPQLMIKNLKTDSVYTYLPSSLKENRHSCLIFNYGKGIYRYGQELLFFTPLDNHIYSVEEKDVKIKYQFDFGAYNLPPDLTIDEIQKSNYTYGFNSFWENKNFCYFQATMQQYPFDFLYDKKKDILYYGYLSDDLGNYMPHIIAANDEYMLCFANISELISNANYWETTKGVYDRPVSKLVKRLKESDNPVMLLYRFKTDNPS